MCPFRQIITNNEFAQIREVQDAASKLYAEHCPDAQMGKAVVFTNAEGIRAVKRKIEGKEVNNQKTSNWSSQTSSK